MYTLSMHTEVEWWVALLVGHWTCNS